jgi:hypothetical protein
MLALACQGEIVGPNNADPTAPAPTASGPSAGNGSAGSSGHGGAVANGFGGAASGATTGDGGSTAQGGNAASVEPDVNRVAIHRLNNAEYDNTMSDLLGVSSRPGATFIDDEKLLGFDSIAAALGMSDARYEQYFNAADALVTETFASTALRERIMVCTSSGDADTTCAREILSAFAPRAFRRPVAPDEIDRLVALFSSAHELGEDFSGSIQHALKAMLASAQFLYRVELDPNPISATPRALSAHELVSRLSYLLWSTMPDDTLFERAKGDTLLEATGLSAEVERMLGDPRSDRFLESFAGQWLGLRALGSHQVDRAAYPDWNEPLRAAMVQEGLLYVSEFLRGERPITEFFTADVNFVNAPLAQLYGFSGVSGDKLGKVSKGDDARRGFLGLASFLTQTSFAERTAPTLRGKWVLENLLCSEVTPPPANVPEFEADKASGAAADNIRARLEQHRQNPSCAGCHKVLDPIGLGLENFDAIGRYRESYANGDAVDASGELPSGEHFAGLTELSEIVSKDERFQDCVIEKLMTLALSREVVASDATYIADIRTAWTQKGLGLAALLEQIVLSDPFRSRRGEP